jgi:hypothetical protein
LRYRVKELKKGIKENIKAFDKYRSRD